MNALSSAVVLELFEQGQRRTPLARMGMIAPLSLTAGELETRMLELLPASLEGVATCPACNERCETTIATNDILALDVSPLPDGLRLPTGEDIAAVLHLDDPRAALLERCSGGPVPPHLADAIEDALAAADPRADVQLAMTCPNCAHEWMLRFDAIAFLWNDVAASAERVLADIDVLARAYGWGETEILSMSAHRRALYVERLES